MRCGASGRRQMRSQQGMRRLRQFAGLVERAPESSHRLNLCARVPDNAQPQRLPLFAPRVEPLSKASGEGWRGGKRLINGSSERKTAPHSDMLGRRRHMQRVWVIAARENGKCSPRTPKLAA